MRVKILEINPGIPLEKEKSYKVNFETDEHYIIFNNAIWCGVYKSNAEIINEYMYLNNGQLSFNLM
ncbi:hypothetical protein [uncultured Clostridium sp.]|uniref:hypothetical protein n=1 Tax=uncultured Clostridium sp. TaxID=59620 RepID=UPI0025D18B55|nr:hypothetical protein [uncultured Clostridium sp.]MDU4882977.1 hypothetical protein [Clostridium celatum]MDU7076122.1 hypothetical protein [Clostridium celatum]